MQAVLTRWRSKPKNHPAYEDEEHSLQGKTGKVKTSSNFFFPHLLFLSLIYHKKANKLGQILFYRLTLFAKNLKKKKHLVPSP